MAKKILMVEDDVLLINMYSTKFASEGYEVISAQDGLAGLTMAMSNKPDIIVLDIMMPKLSGLDFLQKLRSDAWGQSVPVIVLSNLSQEGDARKAIALGVKEYLIKANLTPGQVSEKIKSYLT